MNFVAIAAITMGTDSFVCRRFILAISVCSTIVN